MKFNPAKFRELERKTKASVPKMLDASAAIAIQSFVSNFEQEGFFGERWVDNRRKGHILLKSGRLRSSIRVLKRGAYNRQVGSKLDYADIHNFGQKISRSKSGKRMPQRKFIGKHNSLDRKIKYIITRDLKKILISL